MLVHSRYENNCHESSVDDGLARLLQQRLKLFGSAIAIESGENEITFSEVHWKALTLAQQITSHQINREEPIGILAPRGINHIISQAAVIYAGGSCVPLDVEHPDQHIDNLLRNLNASLVLSDSENCSRLPNFKHVVVDYTSKITLSDNFTGVTVSDNDLMSRSHIFHTSGSTGKPKAVQVLAAGVVNLIFNDFAPVQKGYRLGHVCNIGFDVSMWEIWSGLLHGATIVIFDRHVVLDPVEFSWRLRKDRINVMWQTTSLLATITHACPQAYASMDTLLTGGEAINLQTIRMIFANGPPKRFFNVYGPTELSVFTTYHMICPEDVETGRIPIGRPLSNLEPFIVDETLHPVPDGEIGELLVGGIGVAAGYFANPEKTSMAFVSAPHLPVACPISTGLFYRTGDVVRLNDSGLLEYLGRQDNEVKIRGQRVELESVEWYLLQTKLVSAAVALKVEPQELKSGSILLAYAVPISSNTQAQEIREAYSKLAPHFMVPRVELLGSLVLTHSGKVDRKRLARKFIDELQSINLARNTRYQGERNTESYLQEMWLRVLGLPDSALKADDDFFHLGGTSLQAATLATCIQQSMGVPVRVASLFENSTLQGMRDLIEKTRNGHEKDTMAEKALWLRDSQLGKELKPLSGLTPDWRDDSEGRVFMTGSTGFIGTFLLAELLSRPQVKMVACLVRAKDRETALGRIRDAFMKYRLNLSPEDETRITALPGDLTEPDFGLGYERYDNLAEWSSVVFHVGAQVSYLQPYSTHRATNVLGTLNMIRFANFRRIKGLHYASSISAYGPTGLITRVASVPEDEKPSVHYAALSYDTGYAQSQFVAEEIAWNAIDNGLPVTIYRPGFVLGHAKTGILNPDDFYGRVIATCIETGYYPLLCGQREDFVPVDFVVSALSHIASDSKNYGHAYNLVHPNPDASTIDLLSTFELINKLHCQDSSPMRGVPYAEWLKKVSHSNEGQKNRLWPLMPMLEEKVFGDRTRWEMQQGMPEFKTDNMRRALATCPELLQCPPIPSLVPIYLPYWIEAASK